MYQDKKIVFKLNMKPHLLIKIFTRTLFTYLHAYQACVKIKKIYFNVMRKMICVKLKYIKIISNAYGTLQLDFQFPHHRNLPPGPIIKISPPFLRLRHHCND